MWAFMTTGTTQFLKKMADAHQHIDFYFMKSGMTTLVYYESHKKKSIFVSGRSFQIVENHRTLHKKGFVVMESIPVTEDGIDIFAERMRQSIPSIIHTPGLFTFKLLKQLKSSTYVILSQWETEQQFNNWQQSSEYEQISLSKMARLPAYFAERPYISTYYMLKEEE